MASHRSLIFTYGTLKRGFANHTLMQGLIDSGDAVYVGRYSTDLPFPLICGPYGIPFLINLPGQGHRVSGELFSVSPRGLCDVDELEGTSRGYYDRLPIRVSCIENEEQDGVVSIHAEAYFAHRSFAEGLWRRKERVGLSEYSERHVKEYVRRSDRPKNWSFIEGIKAFAASSN